MFSPSPKNRKKWRLVLTKRLRAKIPSCVMFRISAWWAAFRHVCAIQTNLSCTPDDILRAPSHPLSRYCAKILCPILQTEPIFWRGETRRHFLRFLEEEKTCNATHFSELVRECKSLRRKSPRVPLWLLIDNAPIHKTSISQRTIEECGFVQLPQPPYSPDIALSDFFLFSKLKKHLSGHLFSSAEEAKNFTYEHL